MQEHSLHPALLRIKKQKDQSFLTGLMELMTRIELVNLILTKDALYRLSYISTSSCRTTRYILHHFLSNCNR